MSVYRSGGHLCPELLLLTTPPQDRSRQLCSLLSSLWVGWERFSLLRQTSGCKEEPAQEPAREVLTTEASIEATSLVPSTQMPEFCLPGAPASLHHIRKQEDPRQVQGPQNVIPARVCASH